MTTREEEEAVAVALGARRCEKCGRAMAPPPESGYRVRLPRLVYTAASMTALERDRLCDGCKPSTGSIAHLDWPPEKP